MHKEDAIFLSAMAAIMIAYIIYVIYKHKKSSVKVNTAGSSIASSSLVIPSMYSDVVDPAKILHKNDTGNTVEALQKAINSQITSQGLQEKPLDVDGIFGPLTEDAVDSVSNSQLQSGLDNVSVNAVNSL